MLGRESLVMARYIDAEKLKERLEKISVVTDDMYGMGINRGLDRAVTEIDMLPEADVVEVRHGPDVGDISESEEWYGSVHICGLCGCNWMIYITQDSHYCPHCGVKTDGRRDT